MKVLFIDEIKKNIVDNKIVVVVNDLNYIALQLYNYLNRINIKYLNSINLKSMTYNTYIDIKNNVSYILVRYKNNWIKFISAKKILNKNIILDNKNKKIIKYIFKNYGVESSFGNYAKKIFLNSNIENKKYLVTINNKEYNFINKSYYSGLCFLNSKYKNKILNDVNIIDINSLYPFIMFKYELPVRRGVYYKGKYKNNKIYKYYIQHIKVDFKVKNMGIAFLHNKNFFNINEKIENSNNQLIDLYLTNFDIELLYKNYDIYEIYFIDGYMYSTNKILYKNYIEKFYKLKNNTKNELLKRFYKLLLNSLYGKLGSRKKLQKKEPCILNDKIVYKLSNKEIDAGGWYMPASIFIASIGRYILLKDIEKIKNDFIYCDTDSIHFLNSKNIKIFNINKKMGSYKIEAKNATAKYLKLKTYIYKDNKNLKKVVAGVPAEDLKNINFNNLKNNTKILVNKKVLKNGILTTKKIKVKI